MTKALFTIGVVGSNLQNASIYAIEKIKKDGDVIVNMRDKGLVLETPTKRYVMMPFPFPEDMKFSNVRLDEFHVANELYDPRPNTPFGSFMETVLKPKAVKRKGYRIDIYKESEIIGLDAIENSEPSVASTL